MLYKQSINIPGENNGGQRTWAGTGFDVTSTHSYAKNISVMFYFVNNTPQFPVTCPDEEQPEYPVYTELLVSRCSAVHI